jgi:hypothetical protein
MQLINFIFNWARKEKRSPSQGLQQLSMANAHRHRQKLARGRQQKK